MVEEEQRGRDDAREAAAKAERRVGDIASELDELRNQLEQVRVSLYLPINSTFMTLIVDNHNFIAELQIGVSKQLWLVDPR